MRFPIRHRVGILQSDMTPMIDMAFQLVAFFMVVVNFSEAEQNQLITLPASELAKPPETPLVTPITLQVTKEGTVILGGNEPVSISGLRKPLSREKQLLDARRDQSAENATIVIRGDRNTKTGQIQEVIEVCQKVGFDKFDLRAKQEDTGGT